MGLFQSNKHSDKKSPSDETTDAIEHLFDDEFREDLKNRGRLYFERVINENAALFKQDLDATVAHINTELRQHVARQLDEQFAEINKVNADLRDHIAKQLEGQLAEFGQTMQDAQKLALESLNRSAQALQEQQQQLGVMLQKGIADQQALMTSAFEQNMARIIEHYLLGALGDQFDFKAQLPSIIKQMESNKQAIVDDMKL